MGSNPRFLIPISTSCILRNRSCVFEKRGQNRAKNGASSRQVSDNEPQSFCKNQEKELYNAHLSAPRARVGTR